MKIVAQARYMMVRAMNEHNDLDARNPSSKNDSVHVDAYRDEARALWNGNPKALDQLEAKRVPANRSTELFMPDNAEMDRAIDSYLSAVQ